MQEFEQESQEEQEQSGYQTSYAENYQSEQRKIQPYEQQRQGYALHIVAIVLSAIGFCLSIVGIVGATLVLQAARYSVGFLAGRMFIVGGVLALVSSILVIFVFIAIFVVALVLLARRVALRRGLVSPSRWRKILRWQ
jgi:hypothetical protein